MDEAARARRAARDTVDDVEPAALRELIDELLQSRSMSPGALVFRFALMTNEEIETATMREQAAGVQLIYDGLRLTRELAREEPWIDQNRRDEADLSILAADVMVSRGFHLLARTAAAGKAVETVQSFGCDQTHRREEHDDGQAIDARLELDTLELAAIAGTTITAGEPNQEYIEMATDVARTVSVPLPAAEHVLAELDAMTPSISTAPDDSVPTSDS
jgi:hypothetical protein